KWRRAVAIARVRGQLRQRARAQPEQARLLAALRTARLLDLREDVLELVAQEYRDDRGWSLVRTQPGIIAGICDRSPHQVLVTVRRSQYRRAEAQDLHVLMRILARLEQVVRVGADRPVQMLATAVHAGERLLVQKRDQAELARYRAQRRHRQLLMVRRDVRVL